MKLKGRNNDKPVTLCTLIVALLCISIGYAYITTNLKIFGEISFSEEIKQPKDNSRVNILGQTLTANIDNVASEYVLDENGIDFSLPSSDTNGKGLYLRAGTENDEYPIYYYRGEVDNNHILFGGFCWKMVRTTEKGGVKIIYDGVPNNGVCNNTGEASQLSTKSEFNTGYNSLADVGYMYGTRDAYDYSERWVDTSYIYGSDVNYENGLYTLTNTSSADTIENIKTKHYTCKSTTDSVCSTVYYVYSFFLDTTAYAIEFTEGKKIEDFINESFANENDSAIKTTIDEWFRDNLSSQVIKLEDAVWCNDRSMSGGGYRKDSDLTMYDGATIFSAVDRTTQASPDEPDLPDEPDDPDLPPDLPPDEPLPLGLSEETDILESSNTLNAIPHIPALKDKYACQNKNDRFTVNDTQKGNGALTYPVGLITVDEIALAGYGWKSYSLTSYLYTGQSYWTLSPSYAAKAGIDSSSEFLVKEDGTFYGHGLSDFAGVRPAVVLKAGTVATSGDGTSSNPYIIG